MVGAVADGNRQGPAIFREAHSLDRHSHNIKGRVESLIARMKKAVWGKEIPAVSRIARKRRDPFKILISTVLSLRTKDEVTMQASKRLFALAQTPEGLAAAPVRAIEKAIYPVGFYRTKARTVKEIAAKIDGRYAGVVPDSLDELLALKGVGRKTANLVITLGYGKKGICVDTHVHSVSNRLGIVKTKSPRRPRLL